MLIGISLPVTLVLSFILMYAFDVSLNLISLGGIALGIAVSGGFLVSTVFILFVILAILRLLKGPIGER